MSNSLTIFVVNTRLYKGKIVLMYISLKFTGVYLLSVVMKSPGLSSESLNGLEEHIGRIPGEGQAHEYSLVSLLV